MTGRVTWQPTPMNRSRFTFKASTVAKVFKFGLRVGFTPPAFRISCRVLATT